ncbi:ABC transporter substrate-binding protein [Calothrix sp. CCY 0018]|uniref:ABC transporter substrate-binding protein n=1 Tax=Calothrix sp. CCY 0018 TaxID=3103864 RepID=UPI0039C74B0F
MQQLHRFIKLLFLASITFLLISACNSNAFQNVKPQNQESATSECQIIQHDAGETKICGVPKKVAVLGPHMLDILLSLGIQPAGYAEFSAENIGQPVSEIPVLGDRVNTKPVSLGLRNTPSLEAIVRLKPDLIIGEDFLRQYYSNLSAIAPTVLFSGQENDWKQSIPKIAQIFGREAQAKKIVELYNQKVANLRSELAAVRATYPRVLLFASSELPASIEVRTGNSFSGVLFQELGFDLVLPENYKAAFGEISISLEVLSQLEPDIIIAIVTDYLHEDAMDRVKNVWKQNPLTQLMQASKQGRVYFVNYYTWGSNMRGPIAADIILEETRQILLSLADNS